LLTLRQDMKSLRTGVRDGRDFAARIVSGHPQRQRAPSASQFQNLLTVRQERALSVQAKHFLLCFAKGLRALRIVGTGVLELRSQAELEEPCGQLIMLSVG